MSLTEKEYSQATESGASKRRNGGRIGDNPYRGKTPRVRMLNEAWNNGFMAQHEKLQEQARKALADA